MTAISSGGRGNENGTVAARGGFSLLACQVCGSQRERIRNESKKRFRVDFRPELFRIVRSATCADQQVIAPLSQKPIAVSVHERGAEPSPQQISAQLVVATILDNALRGKIS